MISGDPHNVSGPRSEEKSYLFSANGLGSPLEELRSVYDKKLRTAQNLGENEKAKAIQEAYDLARKRLESILGVEPEAR